MEKSKGTGMWVDEEKGTKKTLVSVIADPHKIHRGRAETFFFLEDITGLKFGETQDLIMLKNGEVIPMIGGTLNRDLLYEMMDLKSAKQVGRTSDRQYRLYMEIKGEEAEKAQEEREEQMRRNAALKQAANAVIPAGAIPKIVR